VEDQIEIDRGSISDGYHTFSELYDHRCHLFVALMRSNPGISWYSPRHADGSADNDWFIAGMDLPTGAITYHLPMWMMPMLDNSGVEFKSRAPQWDGHTPADVVKRLAAWFKK
jgi:hypothetical protein